MKKILFLPALLAIALLPLVSAAGENCTKHYECAQKQFCYYGSCLIDPKIVIYHCGKSGCPPGWPCVDADGKKGICAEDATYTCSNACDCGPAHCCKNGVCVKDLFDPWKLGGTAIGQACQQGADATYCCSIPECSAAMSAYGNNSALFRCYSPFTNKTEYLCGKTCYSGMDCPSGESCVDVKGKAPPGKISDPKGGRCLSNAVAEANYGFASSEIIPPCTSCIPGMSCDAGWKTGAYAYERIVAVCGSCGDNVCSSNETYTNCPADCKGPINEAANETDRIRLLITSIAIIRPFFAPFAKVLEKFDRVRPNLQSAVLEEPPFPSCSKFDEPCAGGCCTGLQCCGEICLPRCDYWESPESDCSVFGESCDPGCCPGLQCCGELCMDGCVEEPGAPPCAQLTEDCTNRDCCPGMACCDGKCADFCGREPEPEPRGCSDIGEPCKGGCCGGLGCCDGICLENCESSDRPGEGGDDPAQGCFGVDQTCIDNSQCCEGLSCCFGYCTTRTC